MKKILFAFTMLLAIAACNNTGAPRQSGDGLAQGAEQATADGIADFDTSTEGKIIAFATSGRTFAAKIRKICHIRVDMAEDL